MQAIPEDAVPDDTVDEDTEDPDKRLSSKNHRLFSLSSVKMVSVNVSMFICRILNILLQFTSSKDVLPKNHSHSLPKYPDSLSL